MVMAEKAELSVNHLAHLAIQKDIHRHIYRYDFNKPLGRDAIARTFSAIVGAVWIDSGENLAEAYKLMLTMGLDWPKNLFNTW
jgi:dsRNA-specific ribonuclease